MRPQHVRMTRDPTVVWCLPSGEPQRISAQTYIARNYSPCQRFALLTVCVYLYQFSRNYFSKVAQSEPAKPARKQHLTRNSRATSCKVILGSLKSWRRTVYCHIIMLALSLKFPKKQPVKTLKIAVLDNSTVVWCPSPWNPREYQHNTYIAKNYSQWPTFLPLIVWVYLHSSVRGGLRKSYLFCNRMRIGRSRSSKVVDFGTNRKLVCDFLLVINNFDPILHLFWDTATYWLNIVNVSYPTVI